MITPTLVGWQRRRRRGRQRPIQRAADVNDLGVRDERRQRGQQRLVDAVRAPAAPKNQQGGRRLIQAKMGASRIAVGGCGMQLLAHGVACDYGLAGKP